MLRLLTPLFLIFVLASSPVMAEAQEFFILPALKEFSNYHLELLNPTQETAVVQLYVFASGAVSPALSETIAVEPQSTMTRPMKTLAANATSILLRPKSANFSALKASLVSETGDQLAAKDESHESSLIRLSGDAPVQISTLSLSDVSQTPHVKVYDRAGQFLAEYDLPTIPPRGTLSVKLDDKIQSGWITLTSGARLLTLVSRRKVWEWAPHGFLSELTPHAHTAFFLVGSPQIGARKSVSFVVALDSPRHIEMARLVIQNPTENAKVIIGELGRGNGTFNRSPLQSGQPLWSWHLKHITSITDYASIDCDSAPQDIEDFTEYFLKKQNICFWGLTFLRELTRDEVSHGLSN